MKIQYTNQELTERLTSDRDVEKFRQQMIKFCNYKILIYCILMLCVAISIFLIFTYRIESDVFTGIEVIVSMLIIGKSYSQIDNYNIKKIKIINATTSLSAAERCIDFSNFIDVDAPHARQLSQTAQAQGRQLYNFDIDYIIDLLRQQSQIACEKERTERKLQEKKEEDAACKKIHGISST